MPSHDIVVIGASAGGIEALSGIARRLPKDLPAALFVAVHLPPNSTSYLPEILHRIGPLPAAHPHDGEAITRGRIYVAPPDHHMLIIQGRISLVHGPRENRFRPAIDPLFRSAARTYGPCVVGVVLSGTLDDGTAGLRSIKRYGGVAVVQDPLDALFPSMPAHALEYVNIDYRLPLAEIAQLIQRLAHTAVNAEGVHGVSKREGQPADRYEVTGWFDDLRLSRPSPFGCPDCGGVLWEVPDDEFTRYRCRVGHAYTAESLLSSMTDEVEDALWTALRVLEERRDLTSRLVDRSAANGQPPAITARFRAQHAVIERQIGAIRYLLLGEDGGNDDREAVMPVADVALSAQTPGDLG